MQRVNIYSKVNKLEYKVNDLYKRKRKTEIVFIEGNSDTDRIDYDPKTNTKYIYIEVVDNSHLEKAMYDIDKKTPVIIDDI